MKLHNIAVVGGGGRGKGSAERVMREKGRAKIVGAAEPDENRRAMFREKFALPDGACFKGYRDLLRSGIKIGGVFITTMPDSHAEIACAFLENGIPVFLEKPMSDSIDSTARIVNAAKKTGTLIHIGFNCRYAPFFEKIKEIVSSGKLGEIVSVEWKEILTPHHWSTYCRYPSYNKRNVIGSWLLEKCCHDLDLMNWIIDSRCSRVCSFGNRSHFNRKDELPQYCTDGCPVEKSCIFSAYKSYPELRDSGSKLEKYKSLCVYKTDSDLVDHQSSVLEYENGVTVCFSLLPLGSVNTRTVYICGTEAALNADWIKNIIRIVPHESGEEIFCGPDLSSAGGHGGGDQKIISAFLDYLDDRNNRPKTTIEEGWESMVVGCGIDKSLKEHRVVELSALRNMVEGV